MGGARASADSSGRGDAAPRRRGSTRARASSTPAPSNASRRSSAVSPVGLDRIRPRREPSAAASAHDLGEARDPLGRAALFSSGSQQQPRALGTFLVECSACHRETPVTAGDIVRLSLPSIHLPLVKRYPSLMRCPACGRRTWVRVRWRL
jgi:hypothetical protein